jgi:diguanylate cyclase (GGDEF)-like protein
MDLPPCKSGRDRRLSLVIPRTRDPLYSRRFEACRNHLGLEAAALRVLLIKTPQGLTAARTREKRAIPPTAVLYLDLDGFKALNDWYGYGTGDALLGAVAQRMSHALRAEDWVGRPAGDEYACSISGLSSRERLQQLAAILFHAVAAPFKISGLELMVRLSIGIAGYPSEGSTTDELMKAADSAMCRPELSNRLP